jgi:selenide,water dikinase
MRQMPPMMADGLIVSAATMDDAAVYQLRDDLAVVATIDVFTPVVDDPFDFGAIAAANALSDVYAMAATPLLALNFAGFPRGVLSLDVLAEIQRGGAEKILEAGAVVVGGHTVDDPEPKFGMVVIGTVHPDVLITNAGARPGDVLVLTKPIGTGVISTALKHDAVPERSLAEATQSMRMLNRDAADVASRFGAHAMTDISGFGLLGHAREMMVASSCSATVFANHVPVFSDVRKLIAAGEVPGGTQRNLEALEDDVLWESGLSTDDRLLLADAQTSGGLLIAIPPEDETSLRMALNAAGVPVAATVARVVESREDVLHISVSNLDPDIVVG